MKMTTTRLSLTLRLGALVIAAFVLAAAFGPGDSLAEFQSMFAERRAAVLFAVSGAVAAVLLPTRWLERLVPAALMTVLSVALAEVALRFAVGEQYATTIEFDGDRLFRLAPGTSKLVHTSSANGGERFRVVIDAAGNRQSVDGRVAAAGDVVVVGDSFIEGESTPDSMTFVERLQGELAGRTASASHVVNGGVIGYGPDQILLRISDELPRLRPRLLVVSVFVGNDFGDLQRNHLFRLDSLGRLVRQRAVVSPQLVMKTERGKARWMLGRLIFRIRNAPAPISGNTAQLDARSLALVDEWMVAREEEARIAATGDTVVTNLFDDTPDVDVAADPDGQTATRKRDLLVAVLDSIGRFAASQSVPVVFVLIPSAIDVVDSYEGGRLDSLRFPAYRRAGVTARLAERLTADGHKVVDLFAPFRASKERLYLGEGDNHWNARGQALAASILADSVAPWLTSAPGAVR